MPFIARGSSQRSSRKRPLPGPGPTPPSRGPWLNVLGLATQKIRSRTDHGTLQTPIPMRDGKRERSWLFPALHAPTTHTRTQTGDTTPYGRAARHCSALPAHHFPSWHSLHSSVERPGTFGTSVCTACGSTAAVYRSKIQHVDARRPHHLDFARAKGSVFCEREAKP